MTVQRIVMVLLALLALVSFLSGCSRGDTGLTHSAQSATEPVSTVAPNAQQAVDAVFQTIRDDVTFKSFPRTVGTAPGQFGIGGPAPGETIPVTFETRANAQGGGTYEVQLIMHWGESANITYRFQVDATGKVRALGHTGDWPAPKPTPPTAPAALDATSCPYAGAIVDVTYPNETDLAKIRDVFSSLGWKQTNTGVHEVINGTLDGAAVSALVSGGKTFVSVHILRSQNEADYPQEDKEAEALLRRVKAPVEKALGLHPLDNFVHRINRGCEG